MQELNMSVNVARDGTGRYRCNINEELEDLPQTTNTWDVFAVNGKIHHSIALI